MNKAIVKMLPPCMDKYTSPENASLAPFAMPHMEALDQVGSTYFLHIDEQTSIRKAFNFGIHW